MVVLVDVVSEVVVLVVTEDLFDILVSLASLFDPDEIRAQAPIPAARITMLIRTGVVFFICLFFSELQCGLAYQQNTE
jgi:hypothetical protein